MRALEHLLARASLTIVRSVDGLWRPCSRCETVRVRWHRHEALPVGVVLQLHSTVGRRGGGDVA